MYKKLIPLLLFVFAAFFLQSCLGGQPDASPPPNTPIPTSFNLNIPQKALWRNYLFVSAEATDGASCRLTYIPPSGNKKVMDVTADSSGLCEWRWKIEEADGKGNARLIFTIDGVSETHFIEVRSSF